MATTIKISEIDAEGRLRPVDRDHADFLAISINETGLKHPIVVRPTGNAAQPYKLVVGAHRLEAFKMLVFRELEIGKHVVIQEMSDDEARLSEIDENLARHELNALDRALFLLERKGLYERIHPETRHGGDRRSKARTKSQTLALGFREPFSRAAAKKLGLSDAAIKLSVKLAEDLDEEAVKLLRGTKIERNQRELLALAELDDDKQRVVAGLIAAGAAKTTSQAKVTAGFAQAVVRDPQKLLLAQWLSAWEKMDRVTRETALEHAGLTQAKGGKK
ncbi:ParB/RepB/Spo0J family partition protein [Rhodoblastus sp.]|uniref:ParB/RepB/Spo0J family partition protein n=1 Tax=Rhodoblastus sp. TaxID=1962975 RepID=UPI003F9AABAD